MIHTIRFDELSAILLDFVDNSEGFLYLRMVGAEPAVNAIWARLSGNENRGKKWGSPVSIPVAGRSFPQYVAAQKHVSYRTLRTHLPSGTVDLALIHPLVTVAEDKEQGFYLLTYAVDLPPAFFDRLNKSLSIPLRPEWAAWLWEQGRQSQPLLTPETRPVREGGEVVKREVLTETTPLPIERLQSLGRVHCYSVRCDGPYRQAWLQIIRRQLDLGIRLKKTGQRYRNDNWVASPAADGWALRRDEEIVAQAPSLNHLLVTARETLGVHFIIEETQS